VCVGTGKHQTKKTMKKLTTVYSQKCDVRLCLEEVNKKGKVVPCSIT
jgi:hypothetical protein